MAPVPHLTHASARLRLAPGFVWLPRIALVVVFGYGGLLKAFDPSGFLADIEAYRVTGYQFSVLIAYYLPWLEIACAVAILIPKWTRPAAAILTALMATFTVLLISAWVRGLNIECGCFGQSFRSSDYVILLIRDLVLLATAATALVWRERSAAITEPSQMAEGLDTA